jgi:hypothetical protein
MKIFPRVCRRYGQIASAVYFNISEKSARLLRFMPKLLL